jgi:hypothetical protein
MAPSWYFPTPFWNLSRQFFALIHRQKYRTFGLERFLTHCFQPE